MGHMKPVGQLEQAAYPLKLYVPAVHATLELVVGHAKPKFRFLINF